MKNHFLTIILFVISAASVSVAQSSEFYFTRGLEKHQAGDYAGAIQDYTSALEQNEDAYEIYYLRGIAKSLLKDYRGAVKDENKAIELNPDYAGAYYVRGIAEIALGDLEAGCLDLSKAGELGHTEAYNMIESFCN